MLNRKKTSMLLASGLAIGLLAGCGSGGNNEAGAGTGTAATGASSEAPKEKVKLSLFIGAVETVDWFNEVTKKFNEENPGIVVEPEFQKEATNALKIKVASGDTPDMIFSINVPQELYDEGYFADLAGEKYWDRMDPAIKELAKDKSGKNFTIPFNKGYSGLFYNKKMFDELGLKEAQTWEEFVSNLQAVKAKYPDVVPFYQGGKDSWTLGQQFIYLALGDYQQKHGPTVTKNAQLNNDKTILKFDEPGSPVEAYAAKMLELQSLGLLNKDAVTAGYDMMVEAFANGKAATITHGMWIVNDLLKKNPDVKEILGFASLPPIMADGEPAVVAGLEGNISIAGDSPYQEQIRKFLDFIYAPENAMSMSKLKSAPSVFNDAATDWSVIADQVDEDAGRAMNIDWGVQPTGYNWDEFGKTIQELLVGGYSKPEDFAKTFQKSWDKGYGK